MAARISTSPSRYVEIAVNVPQVREVFHYHLPPELAGRVKPGHLVVAPFGKQLVHGVVLRFVDTPLVEDTRPVLELVDPGVVLTAQQIELALSLAEENLAPLAACIRLMLPPGLAHQAEALYSLTESGDDSARPEAEADLSEMQEKILALLRRRGPLRGTQLDKALPRGKWRNAMRSLERRALVQRQSVLPPPKVQPKVVRTVQLACPPEQAQAALPELGRAGSKALERRQAMLRFLLREPGPVDVSWVYAESQGSLADLRCLAERELVVLGESEVWRNPLAEMDFQPTQAPPLTRDQAAVWSELSQALQRSAAGESTRPMLLHGVTGSGKTEIYLRAVEETLRLGRQAIVLVPEIALTPQTVRRFVGRFPGRVGLLHSGLTDGERYDTWRRARAGELAVIVGPRSALFTPFPNLGLIVVDESHDESYYQAEHAPYYHVRQASCSYAKLAGAVCLFGTATPDIACTYRASQGEYQYLHLPRRILAHREAVQSQASRLKVGSPGPQGYRPLEGLAEAKDLPPVQVVDMRLELQSGNRSIFSRALQDRLAQVLAAGQQGILFLNRRGTATFIFCRDCGHSLCCPQCETPLTYHAVEGGLICHLCGYRRRLPKTCPECKSDRIRQYGTGTAKVEAELQAAFPEARILRWDHETTRHKGAHEVILSHFSNHRADFLVGTQMLAKGLDLPLVTLVGVVLADVGLNLPDYRASERTFQVLTQVAGRAGRSLLGGEVILQTFLPEHYAIQAAAGHNYRQFYLKELEYRRMLGYPPFARLVRLEYRSLDNSRAEREAQQMAGRLRAWIAAEDRRQTQLIGPAPCFFSRIGGEYRWQIVLRGPDPASMLRNRPLGDWKVEVNPPNLL